MLAGSNRPSSRSMSATSASLDAAPLRDHILRGGAPLEGVAERDHRAELVAHTANLLQLERTRQPVHVLGQLRDR